MQIIIGLLGYDANDRSCDVGTEKHKNKIRQNSISCLEIVRWEAHFYIYYYLIQFRKNILFVMKLMGL